MWERFAATRTIGERITHLTGEEVLREVLERLASGEWTMELNPGSSWEPGTFVLRRRLLLHGWNDERVYYMPPEVV